MTKEEIEKAVQRGKDTKNLIKLQEGFEASTLKDDEKRQRDDLLNKYAEYKDKTAKEMGALQKAEEIEELIKIQDGIDKAQQNNRMLTLDEVNRRNELLKVHKQFVGCKNAQAMMDVQKPHATLAEGPDNQSIRDAYDALAKGPDGKYKEGYSEPTTKDGKTTMTFPSMNEAGDFFHEQANTKGRRFTLVDENNKVLAFSDGKKMYHADGKTEFKKGDELTPGDDLQTFLAKRRESNQENQAQGPGMNSR